jgi:hypothetical protein
METTRINGANRACMGAGLLVYGVVALPDADCTTRRVGGEAIAGDVPPAGCDALPTTAIRQNATQAACKCATVRAGSAVARGRRSGFRPE